MRKKTEGKIKKPSDIALSWAGTLMEETFEAFETAKMSFALLVYEAGNRDREAFRLAMREALHGSWRHWQGRVKLSDAGADSLFGKIESSMVITTSSAS